MAKTMRVGDRTFEAMPRIMRGADENKAVIFFHPGDNPWGNTPVVWSKYKRSPEEEIRRRLYGVATQAMFGKFPKFSDEVHVIDPEKIPAAKSCTNYHFVDPGGGRNFFMHWWSVTKDRVSILRREWPGNYEIPGVGVPGPWAETDSNKLDGAAGPAQQDFGFGLERLKLEICRLERWTDWQNQMKMADQNQRKPARILDERYGSEEPIDRRFMDSRAASTPYQSNDRPTTLLTDFEEMRVFFEPTPGFNEDEGLKKINDALDYNENLELSFFNRPRFLVSRECVNTIFALKTYTGADGRKGACKDPIDLLRYFFLSDLDYCEPDSWKSEGGGSY